MCCKVCAHMLPPPPLSPSESAPPLSEHRNPVSCVQLLYLKIQSLWRLLKQNLIKSLFSFIGRSSCHNMKTRFLQKHYETRVEQTWTRLKPQNTINSVKILQRNRFPSDKVHFRTSQESEVVHVLFSTLCTLLLLKLQVTEFLVKVQLTWASMCCGTKTQNEVTNGDKAQFPVSQWPKRKQNQSKLISTHVDFRRTGSIFFFCCLCWCCGPMNGDQTEQPPADLQIPRIKATAERDHVRLLLENKVKTDQDLTFEMKLQSLWFKWGFYHESLDSFCQGTKTWDRRINPELQMEIKVRQM